MIDPHLFLLGVERTADPATLLGMTEYDAHDPVLIDRALRLRLSQVYQHPDHRMISGQETERVLKTLRDAAAKLRANLRERGGIRQTRPWVLTEFDRNVLAVLVGYGGWNAQSRSRLVALSAMEGVTPIGLMKVIQGLGEYAKSGGPALAISEIRPSRTYASYTALSEEQSLQISEGLFDKFLPDFKKQSIWTTIKLSIVCGLLTILAGVFVVRVLLPNRHLEQLAVEDAGAAVSGAAAGRTGIGIRPPRPSGNATEAALFSHLPTFLGESHPAEALQSRDTIDEHIQALEEVARRLSVSRGNTAEVVFRYWTDSTDHAAQSWLLLDNAAQQRIEKAIVDVLFAAADTPSVTDRLLVSMKPRTGRLLQPLDIWRGVWSASILARIATHENLPPVIRQGAAQQLHLILGEPHREITAPPSPGEDASPSVQAARAYLMQVMPELVERIEYEPAIYNYWELWVAAHRRLGGSVELNRAMVDAAEAIMKSHPNLSGSSRASNVLGRLLTHVDFRQSELVRQRLIGWFESDDISSDDLWALTSMLAFDEIAPWFSKGLIVPPSADMALRRRVRHDVQRQWTLPDSDVGSGAIVVEPAVGEQWNQLYSMTRRLAASSGREPVDLLFQAIMAARLNEAAISLANSLPESAAKSMREVEGMTMGGATAGADAMRVPAITSGNNGAWAAEYEQVRRNTEERLALIDQLRNSRANDLEPLDAVALVREAYRGTPVEVRLAAQAVILQRFRQGPNVAMEMLDQLPDAGRSQGIADMLSEYTGRILPDISGGTEARRSWDVETRLALVQWALAIYGSDAIDLLAARLSESYAGQAQALLGMTERDTASQQPTAAAAMLLDAWNHTWRLTMGSDLSQPELRALTQQHAVRLQLAEGVVQEFAAYQLGILDRMVILVGYEQPHLRGHVQALVRESEQQRLGASHVLEQIAEVEQLMNELWRLRMNLPEIEVEQESAA